MEYKARPRLTFSQALKTALTKRDDTNRRRIRRSEYWWCMLAIVIYYALLFGLQTLLEDVCGVNTTGWLGTTVFTLLSTIPVGLWVMENYGRLHDTNHPDTWLMGVLAPGLAVILGSLLLHVNRHHLTFSITNRWLLFMGGMLLGIALVFAAICTVFCLRDSDQGENDYGPSPKYYREDGGNAE